MKKVAGTLRLVLAQYRELAAFSQFGSDLDKATQAQLNRGERLMEMLKQPQYKPLPVEKQVCMIYVGTNGFLDEYPVSAITGFEEQFYAFLENKHADILQSVRDTARWTRIRKEAQGRDRRFQEDSLWKSRRVGHG